MSYELQGPVVTCGRLSCRPSFIPKPRPRGVKAAGYRFERAVGALLARYYPSVHSGAWFEYQDRASRRVCEIDHYVVFLHYVLLVECKLSETEAAWEQMNLYAPILAKHYSRPVARVQACRYVRSRRTQIDHPSQAAPGTERLWHVLT